MMVNYLRQTFSFVFLLGVFIMGSAQAQNTVADQFVTRGSFEVGTSQITIFDKKRGKELPLTVFYPKSKGSYPLIVFSHGAFGRGAMYYPLIEHWVSHGFITIAPTHEDSIKVYGRETIRQAIRNSDADRRTAIREAMTLWKEQSFRKWQKRPEDVSFIIDSIDVIEKKLNNYPCRIDKNKIGVGGHSFGAQTAQIIGGTIAGGTSELEDRRAKAILMISPQGVERSKIMKEDSWKNFKRPMMVITGTNDQGRNGQDYTWRLDPYKLSPQKDKFLVIIKGAYHGFGGINTSRGPSAGPKNSDHVSWVQASSLAFFDTYLKGSKNASRYLKGKQLQLASSGQLSMYSK